MFSAELEGNEQVVRDTPVVGANWLRIADERIINQAFDTTPPDLIMSKKSSFATLPRVFWLAMIIIAVASRSLTFFPSSDYIILVLTFRFVTLRSVVY